MVENLSEGTLAGTSETATWNKISGAVWVGEPGNTARLITGTAATVLDAGEALACAGYVRRSDWLIVPGVEHFRCCEVTLPDNT